MSVPPVLAELQSYCAELARRARAAGRALAGAQTGAKDQWLCSAADALEKRQADILIANDVDMTGAGLGLNPAALDRLRVTPERLRGLAEGLREVAALPDPVGQVRSRVVRPNGLEVTKVGVPLGVIFFIYESRPNVTVDAAALCVKSGNAVILRGGKEAQRTSAVMVRLLQETLASSDLPADAVQLVATPDRAAVDHLLKMADQIDLVIPRGGEGLIRRVAENARMPVLKHYRGNCHVYIERTADFELAERIVVNSKCQRPGVCNAAESLLIDQAVAPSFLPRLASALNQRGVELRGCAETCQLVPGATPATEADYFEEYLDLILSIKVVKNLEDAIGHIDRCGSGHTETIVTKDKAAAERFCKEVDSAAVLVNASTRFHDGQELGLGAEIGISTDKFHARGPCGLLELTSYKYVVRGEGQIRE